MITENIASSFVFIDRHIRNITTTGIFWYASVWVDVCPLGKDLDSGLYPFKLIQIFQF